MGAVFVLAIVGRRQYRVQLAGFNRPPGARLFLARRLRALAGPPIRSISQQARHYRRPTQRATARRSAAGVGWRAPWRTAGSARQRGSSEQNTILVRFYQAVREGLARFEEGNSLRRHFDLGSGFWIAPDARTSLARVEASESAYFNLVTGSQGTDDTVKYGANDDVGFLPGHLNGLMNLFGQIGSDQLAHTSLDHEKEYHSVPCEPGGPADHRTEMST
jgi:hypothetical protein